jgi:hypothetical protein
VDRGGGGGARIGGTDAAIAVGTLAMRRFALLRAVKLASRGVSFSSFRAVFRVRGAILGGGGVRRFSGELEARFLAFDMPQSIFSFFFFFFFFFINLNVIF